MRELKACERDLVRAREVHTYEVFVNLLSMYDNASI